MVGDGGKASLVVVTRLESATDETPSDMARATDGQREMRRRFAEMGVPSKKEVEKPYGSQRVEGFLDTVTPSGPGERVRAAMQIAASDCPTLSGAVGDLCRELGAEVVHVGALRLAFEELERVPVTNRTVEIFLAVDGATMETALHHGLFTSYRFVRPLSEMLMAWRHNRPTRWEAWRDIETVVSP